MLRFTLAAVMFLSCAAAADVHLFSKQLYPIFEAAGCRGCHSVDGVASPTRLHFPDADASDDRIEAFGKSLVLLVDRTAPEKSVLWNKPTNRIPHSGWGAHQTRKPRGENLGSLGPCAGGAFGR
jgi:hypothetical protein